MNPESKFNHWVAEKLLWDAHIQRIENTAGSGVPDMNICWLGHEFWAESKVETPGGNVLLRPFQWAWIKRRMANGGRVVVIAQRNEALANQVSIWESHQIVVTVHGPHVRIISTPSITQPRTFAGVNALRQFLSTI